jgi:SAM-dependent methyltransferase
LTVHPTAARGFHGEVYERGRPDYPRDVVAALGISAQTAVCDLGCGTGKFTRLAWDAGAKAIGVDPLEDMLRVFKHNLPAVPAVTGVAEALPSAGERFDVVVCASAFHWFDQDAALPEIHRVLRRGGHLGIVWNRRDELTGWPAEFWRITEAYRGDTPGYRTGAWRRALDASPLFGPIREQWFEHVQRTDVEGLVARVASISFIETLPSDERDAVLDEARRFVETHPDTRGRTTFELPYRTAVYSAPCVKP